MMNNQATSQLGKRVKLKVKDRNGSQLTNVYGFVTRLKNDGSPLLVRPEHNLPPGAIIEGVDDDGV